MPLLIRKYKGSGGVMQEERIDDPDRIERYMRLFEEKDVKKLGTGVRTVSGQGEWRLLAERDVPVASHNRMFHAVTRLVSARCLLRIALLSGHVVG